MCYRWHVRFSGVISNVKNVLSFICFFFTFYFHEENIERFYIFRSSGWVLWNSTTLTKNIEKNCYKVGKITTVFSLRYSMNFNFWHLFCFFCNFTFWKVYYEKSYAHLFIKLFWKIAFWKECNGQFLWWDFKSWNLLKNKKIISKKVEWSQYFFF